MILFVFFLAVMAAIFGTLFFAFEDEPYERNKKSIFFDE